MPRAHLQDEVPERLKPGRVVGIVQDDPEAMPVKDVEAAANEYRLASVPSCSTGVSAFRET